MPEENQHARDSAELRRLCSERDQLRHKVAEQARELAEANADFIRKANEAEQLRAELAAAKETITRYETTAENCDLLRAELEAIKGQVPVAELEGLLLACHSALYLFDNKVLEAEIEAALSAICAAPPNIAPSSEHNPQ